MNTNKQINKKYFKIPSLQTDGTLTQEDGLTIYEHYLSQERLDFSKNMRRPVRSRILKEMKLTHTELNVNPEIFIKNHQNNGGKIYFWSDQHFYHERVIEHASRPFDNVAQMNKTMLSNYFSIVKDEDIVIFGGDVGFGTVDAVKQLLQHLPGKKILVLGNHDFDQKYVYKDYDIFDIVTMAFVYQENIEGLENPVNILVTHYPIDNHWLPENTLNIHGHIHQYNADKKNINMAVEQVGYKPKDLKEIIIEKSLDLFKKENKFKVKNQF